MDDKLYLPELCTQGDWRLPLAFLMGRHPGATINLPALNITAGPPKETT
jgi:hypothetical protein